MFPLRYPRIQQLKTLRHLKGVQGKRKSVGVVISDSPKVFSVRDPRFMQTNQVSVLMWIGKKKDIRILLSFCNNPPTGLILGVFGTTCARGVPMTAFSSPEPHVPRSRRVPGFAQHAGLAIVSLLKAACHSELCEKSSSFFPF